MPVAFQYPTDLSTYGVAVEYHRRLDETDKWNQRRQRPQQSMGVYAQDGNHSSSWFDEKCQKVTNEKNTWQNKKRAVEKIMHRRKKSSVQ